MHELDDIKFGDNVGFINCAQKKRFEKTQRWLKDYNSELDFESEVLPYLTPEQKTVFKYYMYSMKYASAAEFDKKENLSRQAILIEDSIFRILSKIADKKRIKKEIYLKFGGESGVEDLILFLTGKAKDYFCDVILDIDPKAEEKLPYKLTPIETSSIKEIIKNKLKEILKRKIDCATFTERYGGEDFLIHDFGSTLDENENEESEKSREFTALNLTLMDYHYKNLSLINDQIFNGKAYFINNTQKIVLRKLYDYVKRKNEVEALLECVSAEKLTALINSLNEVEREILYNYTLAYNQKKQVDLIKQLKLPYSKFEKINNTLLEKIAALSNGATIEDLQKMNNIKNKNIR